MNTLIPCVPGFSSLFRINDDLDNIFETFMGENKDCNVSWSPVADIVEKDDKYTVKVELPGMKQEDIKVSVDDNVLTIKGERKCENESEKDKVIRVERSYGSFTRSFRLPKEIEEKDINATYKDGVLELNLPKSEEKKPRLIDIAVN